MTEKVKLTQEQADAIEDAKRFGSIEDLVIGHVNTGWSIQEYLCLNVLSVDELIRALYIGYEVEPEFEVGDWIVWKNAYGTKMIEIMELTKYEYQKYKYLINNQYGSSGYVRHATPEEIAKEKERRWWSKHGRKVWELKEGDLLISKHDRHSCRVKFIEATDENSVLLVDGVEDELYEDYHDLSIMKYRYKVICFAEDRKDLECDEE